jgi:tetratricopeptide (TPR) repeat protein
MRGAAALLGVATLLVATPGIAAAQEVAAAARLAEGDRAWDLRDHPAARAAYEAVVRADSSLSTRALFRLGVLHAWDNALAKALACHRLYVRLEPADLEGRVALARTYAWASQFPQSLAHYDTVLSREADYRDAVTGRATTLAWAGRLPEAVAALQAWQATHPADAEVALQRARFLSWDGKLDEALALYDSLGSVGGLAEAEKGRARVLAWRGDLGGAEQRWRAFLEKSPGDAEAWVGLGQVLRWEGRTFDARDALANALRLDPASTDAREQLRWVRAETSPSGAVTIVHADDSEDNRSTTVEVSGTVVQRWNARLSASARWRLVSQGSGDVATIPAVGGSAQWQPEGAAWSLRGELGAVQYPTMLSPSQARLTGGVRLSGRAHPRLTLGGGYSRTPFDDVRSTAAQRLAVGVLDADAGLTLHPRVSLGVGLAHTRVDGDAPGNSRLSGSAALRATIRRGLAASLAHREARWEDAAPGIYFAPARFAITEAAMRWDWPRDLGLVASGEAGLGSQVIRFDGSSPTTRLAPRAAVRLGWRPGPGREIVAGWQMANVAAAGTVAASDYRYTAATLTARWSF